MYWALLLVSQIYILDICRLAPFFSESRVEDSSLTSEGYNPWENAKEALKKLDNNNGKANEVENSISNPESKQNGYLCNMRQQNMYGPMGGDCYGYQANPWCPYPSPPMYGYQDPNVNPHRFSSPNFYTRYVSVFLYTLFKSHLQQQGFNCKNL